jgi:hypothetical protein
MGMNETGYMLDTTVFNHVKEKRFPSAAFLGRKICATHVQLDELGRTPDLTTKADLLQIFTDIAPASLATDTPVWDDSKWDETKWPSDDGLYEALLRRIRVLDKKNKPLNQSRDARIAETAIRAGPTLVTDDPSALQGNVGTRREGLDLGTVQHASWAPRLRPCVPGPADQYRSPHITARALNASTSSGESSNHSPFLRWLAKRRCQYVSIPGGSSVLMW